MNDYDAFVASKRRAEVATGHKPGDLNEHLFDYYERMDAIDFTELHGLVLDESSILKAHDGKTRQRIIDAALTLPSPFTLRTTWARRNQHRTPWRDGQS